MYEGHGLSSEVIFPSATLACACEQNKTKIRKTNYLYGRNCYNSGIILL